MLQCCGATVAVRQRHGAAVPRSSLFAVERRPKSCCYASRVIGEITKSVDFCTWQPTAVSQIRQAVLDFQELGTRHREIAAEFFVTEPAESFGDQTRRRAGRISKLIAKFEILSEYRCGNNCHDAVPQFSRKLPCAEFREGSDHNATARASSMPTQSGTVAPPHCGTAALPHCGTAALQHRSTAAPRHRIRFAENSFLFPCESVAEEPDDRADTLSSTRFPRAQKGCGPSSRRSADNSPLRRHDRQSWRTCA